MVKNDCRHEAVGKKRDKGGVYLVIWWNSGNSFGNMYAQVNSPLILHASRTTKSPQWVGGLPADALADSGVE